MAMIRISLRECVADISQMESSGSVTTTFLDDTDYMAAPRCCQLPSTGTGMASTRRLQADEKGLDESITALT
jgi:hypothetical protein